MLCSHALAALALSALGVLVPNPVVALQSDGDGEACQAALIPHPFPKRNINAVNIGYQGGGAYSRTGLVTPEPVPMSIEAHDPDKLLVVCAQNCFLLSISAESDVDWTVQSQGGSPGAFVDAQANEVPTITNATSVLYLPPKDLVDGEARTIDIVATVHEVCQLAADPNSLVVLEATVTRNGEHDFDVSVQLMNIVNTEVPAPICVASTETICEVVGPFISSNPPVTVSIAESPTQGMILGELRPIRCSADDQDLVQMECGTPPGYYPVISNFTQSLKCDDMTYSWAVTAGPGNGTFLYEDRAVLFRATATGMVTIEVTVTTSDGEVAKSQTQFEIFPPLIKKASFKNHQVLLRDSNGVAYAAPHWEDLNGDGDADDVGEKKYPVAYVKGTQVEFDEVFFDAQIKPMPGATLQGIAGTTEVFESGVEWDAASSLFVAKKFRTMGNLPDSVRKLDPYLIVWQIDFGGPLPLPVNTTAHRVYVTFAMPIINYGASETIFDIACRNADGATTVVEFVWGIWTDFVGGPPNPIVRRKMFNGDNSIDNAILTYWASTPCSSTVPMLLSTGDGSCGAWARLLRACYNVHGYDSLILIGMQTPPPPPAQTSLLIKNWSPMAGTNPNPPWQFSNLSGAASGKGDPGVPGQGNPDPTAVFTDHVFVLIGGNIILDSSYGKLYTDPPATLLQKFEDDALFGTVPNITVPPYWVNANTPGIDLHYFVVPN